MVVIMAGINDMTIRNWRTRRVSLVSHSPRELTNLLIQKINAAKSLVLSAFPLVKVAIGGIIGMNLNKYNHRSGVSNQQ